MKALQVDTRPDWRGGQHQILMTLRGLRECGVDAQLLTRSSSVLRQRATAEKFAVHSFARQWTRLDAFLSLRELLNQQCFDVVHVHDPHGLSAAWLARVHGRCALLASRRVAYPLSHAWPGLARYRAAHRIIAVSQFVAGSVVASGIDADRVGVVYDGVEIPAVISPEARRSARQRWHIADATLLLGCVGYLLPEKGQELLLHAMKSIVAEFPSCKLILAGDGPKRARLEALANDLSLTSAVIFAGFVEHVETVYQALDLFVFPSLAEPLGSSLLAAMAHGLPTIAVASGGVPEVITDRRNGMLIDAPDAAQLAGVVCRVLRDRQIATRIGAAARETIAQRFTEQQLAENTLQEYEHAIRIFRSL